MSARKDDEMYNFGSRRRSSKKITGLKPGPYKSKIVFAGYAEEYVAESAIEIRYELEASDGTVVPYKEIFYNDDRNPRTKEFSDYLDAHGIQNLEDLEGLEEVLVIKKSTAGRGLMTIESREFKDDV